MTVYFEEMEEIDAIADEIRKTDVKSPCVNFRVWELHGLECWHEGLYDI